jgi:hypothetical protein
MADPTAGDEVAFLKITKYGDDALAVDGNIGDAALAVWMLEQALEAARSRLWQQNASVLVPTRDMDPITHHPDFPVVALGDR